MMIDNVGVFRHFFYNRIGLINTQIVRNRSPRQDFCVVSNIFISFHIALVALLWNIHKKLFLYEFMAQVVIYVEEID